MKVRALLIIAALGYLAWPYATLITLQQDLRDHDVGALQNDVDWSSVRAGLSHDMLGNFAASSAVTRVSTGNQDDLPPFGAHFATRIADSAIRTMVTPQKLADAFSTASPLGGEAAQPNVEAARFSGLTSFLVRLRPAQLAPGDPSVRLDLRLVRHGWRVGWQVTRVWLPASLLSRSETHAS